MKFNKNYLKRPKYKGVKMYKYVPLLEKQVKIEMGRRDDWMDTALDINEEMQEQKGDKNILLVTMLLIAVILLGETLMIIKYFLWL